MYRHKGSDKQGLFQNNEFWGYFSSWIDFAGLSSGHDRLKWFG